MNPSRFAAAVFLAALLFAPGTSAQTIPESRFLIVTGEGVVKARPDQATLSASVLTEAKTAAAALAANNGAMNAVFGALKRLGIPDRSIQTSEISVQPQYPNDSRVPRRITGYQVSNTVSVTVDDLDRLGPALDVLVSSGANSLGDIGFGLRDPKPLEAQARTAAVRDAVQKAETMARAAGVSLGPIVSITEGVGAEPVPLGRRMPALMAMKETTPVAAGEETISATVTVSWGIR
ncbi:MAG TPA: SIMPL domain-containing protein [Rhizomicrobium sp.]